MTLKDLQYSAEAVWTFMVHFILFWSLKALVSIHCNCMEKWDQCKISFVFHGRQSHKGLKQLVTSKYWFLNIWPRFAFSVCQWWEWSWSPLLLLLQRFFVSASVTWPRLSSIPSTPSMTCTACTQNSTAKVFHRVMYIMSDFKILIGFYSTQTHFSLAGVQPPRPPPPTSNGNLQMQDQGVVYQTGQPVRRPCVSRLNDICTSTRRHYFLACAAIIAFLLTLILIFSFLGEKICLLKLKLMF